MRTRKNGWTQTCSVSGMRTRYWYPTNPYNSKNDDEEELRIVEDIIAEIKAEEQHKKR